MRSTVAAATTAVFALAGCALRAAAPSVPSRAAAPSVPSRAAGANMNGEYTIANGVPGAAKPFPTESAAYEGGVEYFDVYSPLIETRYSQVYWTMMEPVKLPADIVARFDGKTMAITGHEADQVFKGEDGKPDVSVPIT